MEGAHVTVRTDTCHQISCVHMLVLGFVCAEGVVSTMGSERVMTVSEPTGGGKHQLSSPAKAHRARPRRGARGAGKSVAGIVGSGLWALRGLWRRED